MEKRGGLAVPHPKTYFLASQIQQLAGWEREEREDPNRNLVTGTAPSLKAASHLEMGLPSMPQAAPTGTLLRKVWGELRKTVGTEGVLPFTPIWNNPRYAELQDLVGFTSWKKRGIWFFSQLYEGEVLKTYEQLCRE